MMRIFLFFGLAILTGGCSYRNPGNESPVLPDPGEVCFREVRRDHRIPLSPGDLLALAEEKDREEAEFAIGRIEKDGLFPVGNGSSIRLAGLTLIEAEQRLGATLKRRIVVRPVELSYITITGGK